MKLRFPLLHRPEKSFKTLPVIAQKGGAVLIHRPGGLLSVIKGVVLFPEIILQNPQLSPESRKNLPVLTLPHPAEGRNPLSAGALGLIRSIHRRQPLGKKGDIHCLSCCFSFFSLSLLQRPDIRFQLHLNQTQRIHLTGRIHEGQQVIIPPVLRDISQVSPYRLRCIVCKKLQDNAEHPAFPQSLPDIPGKEENLHRQVPVLGKGPDKPVKNHLLTGMAHTAHRPKQIQAIRKGRPIRRCTILRIRSVRFHLQHIQHRSTSSVSFQDTGLHK